MAGNYEVLAGESTVELVGATDVRDVQQITARAIPSGVVFHMRFTPAEYKPAIVQGLTSSFADQFNNLAAMPHVVGVATIQDIDGVGQIVDKLLITISSSSGKTSITRDDLHFTFDPSLLQNQIAETVANLDAIEGT